MRTGYSVVNSLEIWELNNLKKKPLLLCCTFINTNIYKETPLFAKDEVCSSLMIIIFYELVSLVYLPNAFYKVFGIGLNNTFQKKHKGISGKF